MFASVFTRLWRHGKHVLFLKSWQILYNIYIMGLLHVKLRRICNLLSVEVRERKLKWLGLVLCMERLDGKRKPGHPWDIWRQIVEKEVVILEFCSNGQNREGCNRQNWVMNTNEGSIVACWPVSHFWLQWPIATISKIEPV